MTHSALLAQYMSCIHGCEYAESDYALFALPLYHAVQLQRSQCPRCWSVEYRPDRTTRTRGRVRRSRKDRIKSFFAPPTAWVSLLRNQGFDRHDLSSLRKLYYGASIMPAPILAELRERMPGVRTYNVYGLSEIGLLATGLRPEDHDGRLTSAGKPVLNVDIGVVDEQMNDAPTGVVGEIVHRSPQLITCYSDKPEETAEAFSGYE